MKESVYGVCEGMCVYDVCVCLCLYVKESAHGVWVGVCVKEGAYGVSSTLIRQEHVGGSKTI